MQLGAEGVDVEEIDDCHREEHLPGRIDPLKRVDRSAIGRLNAC